jgi:hypothetical protein
MPYRVYSHCVQPQDYVDPLPGGNVAAYIIQIVLGGSFDTAQAECDWLLGGKLVCLGGDRCAIGRITSFDPPTTSFPNGLDNDFSFNILLSPHEIEEFAFNDRLTNYYAVANDGLQGWLITEQKKPNGDTLMPTPRGQPHDPAELLPSPVYHGDFTTEPSSSYISYDPAASPFQVPGSDESYDVPALHVECEGSRTRDVCAALNAVWGPIHASHVCDIPLIGWFICLILSIILLPVYAVAFAIAWRAAQDGNADDARTDRGGGTLGLGDRVIITGRWVYDAGHSGANELHPVKTIQKIGDAEYDDSDFASFYTRWCNHIEEAPPYDGPGVRPADMSPAQTGVFDSQVAPEQQWVLHPLVDGCAAGEPPPGPFPRVG